VLWRPAGGWRPGPDDGAEAHAYVVADGPKALRETLSVAQAALDELLWRPTQRQEELRAHSERLQRLIDECERKRPTGPDGKHGDRHTPECGCDL
jgi:hypothetical protein